MSHPTERFWAKLTEQNVREIRERRSNGETHASIAADFPVSLRTVACAASGDNWGWLADVG